MEEGRCMVGRRVVSWRTMPRKNSSYRWWWTRSNAALLQRWELENELFNPEACRHGQRLMRPTLFTTDEGRCRENGREKDECRCVKVDGKNLDTKTRSLPASRNDQKTTDRGRGLRDCANTCVAAGTPTRQKRWGNLSARKSKGSTRHKGHRQSMH